MHIVDAGMRHVIDRASADGLANASDTVAATVSTDAPVDLARLVPALREAAEHVAHLRAGADGAGAGPQLRGPIEGVRDGTPVLDPRRDAAGLREGLARYAPLLNLREGPLHGAGAPVHRDVARFLGHPVARARMSDGSEHLLHPTFQVGRSDGYDSVQAARFAAAQLMGAGPDAAAGVRHLLMMTVQGHQVAGTRYALAATDDLISATRRVDGLFGSRTETVEAEEITALRYVLEDRDADAAVGIIVDGPPTDAWRPFVPQRSGGAPSRDSTLIARDAIDEMSVVGYDDARIAALRSAESRLDVLTRRVQEAAGDDPVTQHAVDPAAALARRRASDVMRSIGITADAGWSAQNLDLMREGIARTGRTGPDVDEIIATIGRHIDQMGDGTLTTDGLAKHVWDRNNRSIMQWDEARPNERRHIDRARILAGAAGQPRSAPDILDRLVRLQSSMLPDYTQTHRFSNGTLLQQRIDMANLIGTFDQLFRSEHDIGALESLMGSTRKLYGVKPFNRFDGTGNTLPMNSGRQLDITLRWAAGQQIDAPHYEQVASVLARPGVPYESRAALIQLAASHRVPAPDIDAAVTRALAVVPPSDTSTVVADTVRRLLQDAGHLD